MTQTGATLCRDMAGICVVVIVVSVSENICLCISSATFFNLCFMHTSVTWFCSERLMEPQTLICRCVSWCLCLCTMCCLLSAVIVPGQTAIPAYASLHKAFFLIHSYSAMHLCPNNDRSAFNSHSELLLHNAVCVHPSTQSIPLLPLAQEAFRSFEGKVRYF